MIKIYKLDMSEQWDKAVKATKGYEVFYLSTYLKAFAIQDSGEAMLVEYVNGEDRAINVVIRRDISEDKHFDGKLEKKKFYDLTTPYGYGGFMGKVSDRNQLMMEWNEYCRENGYISEFVRFNLFSDYIEYYDGDYESRTHNVVRSLEMSFDEMWMDFKQKVRKNVKRALSNNLEIVIDEKGEYLEEFLAIYYGTMERNDAKSDYYFSREFFKILGEMQDNIIYFHVKHQGRIISTEMVIYGAESAYSYLGGTDSEYFELRPNDFLKYEIIRWCKDKGLKNFVLGGGYGADDGIFQYKTCLAPNGIVDFYIGRKIFNQEKYDELVKMRGDLGETQFFPKYRA